MTCLYKRAAFIFKINLKTDRIFRRAHISGLCCRVCACGRSAKSCAQHARDVTRTVQVYEVDMQVQVTFNKYIKIVSSWIERIFKYYVVIGINNTAQNQQIFYIFHSG
jgi:hypothetical protein